MTRVNGQNYRIADNRSTSDKCSSKRVPEGFFRDWTRTPVERLEENRGLVSKLAESCLIETSPRASVQFLLLPRLLPLELIQLFNRSWHVLKHKSRSRWSTRTCTFTCRTLLQREYTEERLLHSFCLQSKLKVAKVYLGQYAFSDFSIIGSWFSMLLKIMISQFIGETKVHREKICLFYHPV